MSRDKQAGRTTCSIVRGALPDVRFWHIADMLCRCRMSAFGGKADIDKPLGLLFVRASYLFFMSILRCSLAASAAVDIMY